MSRKTRRLPTQIELWKILTLDWDTGFLYWKPRPNMSKQWNTRFAGKRAGNTNTRGYRTIAIDRVAYLEHRLIWQMIHCEEPEVIDHIDGNPSNNCPRNLREATQFDNMANRGRKKGKLLPKGIDLTPIGKFRATIKARGQIYRLGHYDTLDAAQAAYAAKAEELHGEFARID